MKFAAFISYRHGGIDEKVAMQIQRETERYRFPAKIAKEVGKKSFGKVFRDADDLRAASNLSEVIKQGLDESEYLIAICTKRYQESVWCMEEIEYFIEIRGRDNIIVVLVEGEPQESFPKILTEIEQDGKIVNIEPLAVDVRAETERQTIRLVTKEKFRFISRMLNLDYDDLRQRQRERERKRAITLVSVIFACLSIFIGVVASKNVQLNAAYDRLDDSMQQTLRGQSYYLSEYAGEAYLNGDRSTAALLALQALPEDLSNPDRPFVPSVMKSLTDALGIYDFSSGYQADKVFEFEEEAYDTKVEISNDKKLLLVERYHTAAANMLKGEVEVYEMDTRKSLGHFELTEIRNASSSDRSRCARFLPDSQTLLYLGKDGLQAVNVYSGKTVFTGETGCQLVLSEQGDVAAVYNMDEGMLYYYDADGKKRAESPLGVDKKFNLYCISPDSRFAVLSQDAKDEIGILLTDTATGLGMFLPTEESCRQISFINDHCLCVVRQDTQMGRKHIVVYDLNERSSDYLADTDRTLENIAVSGYESCFYYEERKLSEVSSKTGKIIWKKQFLSDVVSVEAKGEYLAVTLKNGQSFFYHGKGKDKELINMVEGNGQSYYMLELTEEYACMSDFWGQNIRVYTRREKERDDVISLDISSVNESAPEKWMTAASNGESFLIDFRNGMEDRVQVFSTKNLQMLGGTTLRDMDYESLDNLSIEAATGDYVSVQDYAYGKNAHFDTKTMTKCFSFDDDSYYFYSDDKSRLTVAKDGKLIAYDAASGKELGTVPLKEGYDRGIFTDNVQIFGSDNLICMVKDGTKDIILKDAVLSTFYEKGEAVFYRNEKGDTWYVYSLKEEKVVCSGESGTTEGTILFDDGNYFLNDYREIYETKTYKKVLDISSISTGVYGVSTRENLPYFVVWYQSGDTESSGRTVGSNIAYLYSKDGSEEIVGVIPNYVATADDGEVIVYDGEHTLYKMPLYSNHEIVKKAKEYVKGISLTDSQKKRYHIYSE